MYPHSVENRNKSMKRAAEKDRVDSNGFDFDSEIHSISNSAASGPLSPPDAPSSAVGRFQIQKESKSESNKTPLNDSNGAKTTKGRFTIQDEET